ncbi:hypothetical protein [Burkholderia sp. Ac-20365]|uniref:hypothetical protein n=1 Tax=Burkholderia sp. Ac-20365 TaxID=2703897 RepID=UPI00197C897E|nr:hypothetical protein [Burkholderia sp. Ac-20365]MBN3761358.1 hypothetical protein [Burkholderia sp. Ac-20365]
MSRLNNIAARVLRNTGIPIAMLLAGAGFGVADQLKEVPAQSYSIIADNWIHLRPGTQRLVADEMGRHGKIIHWHYVDLFDAILRDTSGFVMPPVDQDRDAERARLASLVRSSALK